MLDEWQRSQSNHAGSGYFSSSVSAEEEREGPHLAEGTIRALDEHLTEVRAACMHYSIQTAHTAHATAAGQSDHTHTTTHTLFPLLSLVPTQHTGEWYVAVVE